MPETAINKDGNAQLGEGDVDRTSRSSDTAIMYAVPSPSTKER